MFRKACLGTTKKSMKHEDDTILVSFVYVKATF